MKIQKQLSPAEITTEPFIGFKVVSIQPSGKELKSLTIELPDGRHLEIRTGSSYDHFMIMLDKPKEFTTAYRVDAVWNGGAWIRTFDTKEQCDRFVKGEAADMGLSDIKTTETTVEKPII